MKDLEFTIAITTGVLVVFMFASYVTLWGDIKYYKSVYDELPTYKFYRYEDQIWANYYDKNPVDFIWFLDGNHCKLVEGHYIHAAIFTWCCPHAAYWLIKYRKWMKSNCKPEIIKP